MNNEHCVYMDACIHKCISVFLPLRRSQCCYSQYFRGGICGFFWKNLTMALMAVLFSWTHKPHKQPQQNKLQIHSSLILCPWESCLFLAVPYGIHIFTPECYGCLPLPFTINLIVLYMWWGIKSLKQLYESW